MIAIVDYGMGNLASILNMCRHLGIAAQIAHDPETIARAKKLILPGVGAFDAGMERLEASGLRAVLDQSVLEQRTPVLGICLGMQLLARRSEEGARPGLEWIAADVVRFKSAAPGQPPLQIPHMGWSHLVACPKARLFTGMKDDPRFYFVHSYHMVCDDPDDVAATTDHGGAITAAVEHGHIFGTQFHPEKSHRFGMQLLRNFSLL